MNTKRIALGGLLAALVLMLGEGITEVVFGSVIQKWLLEMGLPAPGESVMALFALMALAVGMLMVWLYAAIRPRYGAGPKAALLAGLTVWALNCLAPNTALWALGSFSAGLFAFATLRDLVLITLAVLAGAYVYREKSESLPETTARIAPTGA